jgi:anti-sigma B factor antagonist
MPETFEPKSFRCETERRANATYLRPHGDLDMRTVPELENELKAARETSRYVVLDLRGLSFMDSTGLTLVSRWNLEARRDGFEFALVQGDDRVRRLFELTALMGYFTFVDG